MTPLLLFFCFVLTPFRLQVLALLTLLYIAATAWAYYEIRRAPHDPDWARGVQPPTSVHDHDQEDRR